MKIKTILALFLSAMMASLLAAVPVFADEGGTDANVAEITHEGGQFTGSTEVTEEYIDPDADLELDDSGDNSIADKVVLSLEEITPTPQPEEGLSLADDVSFPTYAIKLTADGEGKQIVNYKSAELTFNITGKYEITPGDNADMTSAEKTYTFKVKSDASGNQGPIIDHSIVIGYIKITGYGSYSIKITGATINTMDSSSSSPRQYTLVDSSVILQEVGGTGSSGTVAEGSVKTPTAGITINVMFPNKLAEKIAYNDMAITVDSLYDESGEERYSKVINLPNGDISSEPTADGIKIEEANFDYNDPNDKSPASVNANGYRINMTIPVPEDRQYAFKITGKGYRPYAFSTDITDGTVINIWNNVMEGEGMPVVTMGEEASHKENITFLAGDIVRNNKIDIYDLSAVVSYFGKSGDEKAMQDYIQYDLNRDGVIDSRDIAIVLVLWGK